ncbi:mortality factor 4-like protein 1 [Antechinus flavipes]|uniref:mortality factor 4-like protein 1 n=1 Tax=Antechinus flavipes TaxID=38775 RepID=UPI0022365073|nr:mortality factor 4-like protein 1 [Antechinus flavipes]
MASPQQVHECTPQPSSPDWRSGQVTASQLSGGRGAGRGSVPGDQKTSYQFQGRPDGYGPIFQDGEDVLIFQGPKMRKAQCVWVTVEDQQVKYLVRYPPQSDTSPASGGFATRAGAPFWLRSLVSAGLIPSARTVPLGTRSGSSYGRSIILGRGALSSRNRDPLPVVPQVFSEQPLYPISPHGWDYVWIPEGSVLRYSAAYLQRDQSAYVCLQIAAEKQQQPEHPVSLIRGSYYSSPGESSTAGGSRMQSPGEMDKALPLGRRRRSPRDKDATGGLEKKPTDKREVQIHLPIALEDLFLQDWSLVTLTKKLFKVPAKKTVDNILTTYATFQPNVRSTDKKYAVSGLVAVIKEYFDLLLGTQLLYDFERAQYAEILAQFPDLQMSQIYGSAHLLRLFPKLGSVLACSPLNDGSIHVFMDNLQDFLEYLAKNPSQLFTEATDYQLGPEYGQKSE